MKLKNPIMTRITSDIKYYPLFDAYCRNRGLIFWLCGGGFKRGYIKDDHEYVEYNVWPCDAQFLRLMKEELSE